MRFTCMLQKNKIKLRSKKSRLKIDAKMKIKIENVLITTREVIELMERLQKQGYETYLEGKGNEVELVVK